MAVLLVIWFGYLLPVIAIGKVHHFLWGVLAFLLPFIVVHKDIRGCCLVFFPILAWIYFAFTSTFAAFGLWGIGTIVSWLILFVALGEVAKVINAQREVENKDEKEK